MPAKNLRRVAAFSLLLAPLLSATAQTEVRTEQLRAELLAHAPEGVAPGKPLWLGLLLEHAPHWHTYWKNPGDSGLPTKLQWSLPAGVDAGEIEWPVPQRLPVGPLMNYGYEGRVLLPVRVQVPAGFAAPSLSVQLQADWLVCKEVCLPQSGRFSLQLPTQAATAAHAALFEEAQRRLPQTLPGVVAAAHIEGHDLVLDVQGLPAALQGQPLAFFPEQAGILDNAAPVQARWEGGRWQLKAPLSPERDQSPPRLDTVLADAQGGGVQLAFDVAGPWPAPGTTPRRAPAAEPDTAAPASAPAGSASPAFGLALLLALGGGMLLNLMPCVFPVLSLKLLGFVAHHGRRERVAAALAYTAGVLLSFVALAALMLALRAGGQQLGWGFQLQSPAFVATLAVLFTVIGLNLAGQFEFRGVLPSSLAGLQLRHPLLDHALTGVLAVAVASPCTAPFMGASLGAAATLPTVQALGVFAALGLGMALPYLGAAAWPGLARALPRPGPWMAQLRTLLAFPIFATVVWLLWVLGQQTGLDGAVALLGLLVALAFALWALASPAFVRARRGARAGVAVLAVAVLGLTLRWALPAWHEETAAPTGTAVAAGGWEPWSGERVRALQAQGRPVFVDFTAAWCVTCQLNKRGTLADATVRADFELHDVALLRADWTRRDAAIGAELARLGRSGVPVYALYPGGGGAPQLLTEVLSVAEVRAALAGLPARP